jgi:hypothetical protein
MTESALGDGRQWRDLVLTEAEVLSLRLCGNTGDGLQVELRYELGTVTASVIDPSARQVSYCTLGTSDAAALLTELRSKLKSPRPSKVGSSALHAFVSALAVALYSSGPISFGTAAFGVVRSVGGRLVGEVDLGAQTRASITASPASDISFEMHVAGRPSGAVRNLTPAQLRSFIAALRIYLAGSDQAASQLWRQILAIAVKCERRWQ